MSKPRITFHVVTKDDSKTFVLGFTMSIMRRNPAHGVIDGAKKMVEVVLGNGHSTLPITDIVEALKAKRIANKYAKVTGKTPNLCEEFWKMREYQRV